MPPRKYKPKPPMSALDEAAAQHRRAQSCKAQRAYRQRKEDTIATLSKQMQGLEATIERLSTCFLGLNDKILRHLGKVEDAVLAEEIRDSMKEFKGIIEKGDVEEVEEDASRVMNGQLVHRPPSTISKSGNNNINDNGIPTPPDTGLATITQLPYNTMPSSQLQLQTTSPPQGQTGSTIFSGPAFYGLTPQTLSLHPSTPSSSAESLAHRIYTTTIAKAYALLQTHADDDPIFRRVFAIYFTAFPKAQVRGEVARMMMSRDDWNPYYRPRGTEQGWWSSLQVAVFICSRNWVFDKEGDKVCLGREGRGGVEVAVEEFLDVEVLVDARCAWDTPEYRKDTVVKVVLGMMG
ncbi:hypothetical protein D6C85_09055 [Aureobasidium pullulans]|uniref:BZIP domain-containing protein n=1 Tax=Aureobasidium pullulans TaxID=5580 RepID=A0A4S9WDE1_AURPU|nr:hypothetical protein D6C85_09055 [Aureobasidium pullulans]